MRSLQRRHPVRSLTDVVAHARAPEAWEISRGAGVTIAIVDTGICGSRAEFPVWKRSSIDLPTAFQGVHWKDPRGHGSMCAAIAAGTRSEGGRFDGVAPDALLISARTNLLDSGVPDICEIYEHLTELKRRGTIDGPLVISNSYGLRRREPPTQALEDDPLAQVVQAAVDEGIPVVFGAGNDHHDELCRHDPTAAEPSTIWGVNSLDQVISVGAVDWNDSNQDATTRHRNSSRGPGQWARERPKPDCVAPTYGRVPWGCRTREMEWWGTSGACAQVAGLAALLLSVDPSLRPDAIADVIRDTARPTGAPRECVGAGVIDCATAIRRVA